MQPCVLKIKLENIRNYYDYHGISIENFLSFVNIIKMSPCIELVHDIPEAENYIFEGSQGLLLDQHYGFFPHVTRSNTGSTNILEMGFEPELFLVTRAYQTRHGNGPMTNEGISHSIKEDPNETNVSHQYQGEFRRSILDLDLLKYGISKDDYIRNNLNSSTLVITCLDHLKYWELTLDGKLRTYSTEEEFVNLIQTQLGIERVITSHSPDSINFEVKEGI